jgi:hypothetical protein
MYSEVKRLLISHLSGVWLGSSLGLGVVSLVWVFFCSGCARKEASVFLLERVGSFPAARYGDTLDGTFYIYENYDRWALGISVPNLPVRSSDTASMLVSNLSQLRFKMELFHNNATKSFYHAELGLSNNLAYYPLWKPDFGVLVGGGREFPIEMTAGGNLAESTRDVQPFPFRLGKLVPNENYRIRLTVLVPMALTNRLDLWLYGVGSCDMHRKNQKTGVDL